VPAVDLNLSPEWEFSFGAGAGRTSGAGHVPAQMILHRRLQCGRES
jgi:hypothetical protein